MARRGAYYTRPRRRAEESRKAERCHVKPTYFYNYDYDRKKRERHMAYVVGSLLHTVAVAGFQGAASGRGLEARARVTRHTNDT